MSDITVGEIILYVVHRQNCESSLSDCNSEDGQLSQSGKQQSSRAKANKMITKDL